MRAFCLLMCIFALVVGVLMLLGGDRVAAGLCFIAALLFLVGRWKPSQA